MKKFFISLVALLIGVYSLYAQITVSASIDSVQLFIGQQTKLSLQATQPQGLALQFPHFSDTVVTNLELVSTLPSDTLQLDNGLLQVTNSYIVTSFDSALVFIKYLFPGHFFLMIVKAHRVCYHFKAVVYTAVVFHIHTAKTK